MIWKVIQFGGVSILMTFVIALVLIVSQRPGMVTADKTLAFADVLSGPQVARPKRITIAMRDGALLPASHVPGPGSAAPLLVLIHGSGWHGQQFDGLATRLGDVAEVIVPDLRGHGYAPKVRGDVAYIGQLEDDLADLIRARAKPGQKVVLGGHSSGGGLVIRFAGGDHGGMMDQAILMAPFLHHRAPTMRPNSGGWARPLLRRIVGLSMLNMARIHWLDHLTAIQFAMPEAVLSGPLGHTATVAYSWRLNQSFAPRGKWGADAGALPPFLLLVGAEDEAFLPDEFAPSLGAHTDKGRYVTVAAAGHLGLVDAPETEAAIRAVLSD